MISFDAAKRQVVETADVVLEVLDARDPLGSRAQAVEAAVLSKASKKLVLVLNKVCCCRCWWLCKGVVVDMLLLFL